jgi:hypothetical protein
MNDNRLSAIALIAASCGMIITMAVHPTGHITQAQLEGTIRMLMIVHSFALVLVPIQFLGAWGLSRRLAGTVRLEVVGLVFYGMALIAVMSAAVADGLVTPSVLRQIVASADSETAVNTWRMFSRYTFYWNQAYAQVFVVAASAAIFAWSVAMWRGKFSQGLGIYGCILSIATIAVLFSGYLPLDAHRFGAIVLGQAIWFVIAGAKLWNGTPAQANAARVE